MSERGTHRYGAGLWTSGSGVDGELAELWGDGGDEDLNIMTVSKTQSIQSLELFRNSDDDEDTRWDRVGVGNSSLKLIRQSSFSVVGFAMVGSWSDLRWSCTSRGNLAFHSGLQLRVRCRLQHRRECCYALEMRVTLPTVMVCAYADSDSEFTAMLSRVFQMCMENLAVWSCIGAINMERQECQICIEGSSMQFKKAAKPLLRPLPDRGTSHFLEFALLTMGSPFTVGVAEECDSSSVHVMAGAPEDTHKMAATTTTPRHVSADRPESRHVSADRPESHHVSGPVRERRGLLSSLDDPPLTSARAAGIPKPPPVATYSSSPVFTDKMAASPVSTDKMAASPASMDKLLALPAPPKLLALPAPPKLLAHEPASDPIPANKSLPATPESPKNFFGGGHISVGGALVGGAPELPWLPDAPDPPWHLKVPELPWLPEAPDPPWLPEAPDPPWRLESLDLPWRPPYPSVHPPSPASRSPGHPPLLPGCAIHGARTRLPGGRHYVTVPVIPGLHFPSSSLTITCTHSTNH
ncbi:hypothetical protein DPX16_4610 [Anabarilius grahami]|uniref:Uncharacterized protein n=1 Tax=Anabarilius grahami TaxID=495550 RepID=A0A3N0YC05_ANAGA|nr:hypothetical protein DPX16_4610 [Anabarilius grahami]